MELILRRHGSTPGNQQRRYIGTTEESLCEQGREQARRCPGDSRVQAVYVSQRKRTWETAEILYPKARLIPIAGFNEMDFGAFEGKDAQILAQDARYQAWVDGGCRDVCPDGEGQDGFAKRCCESFCSLLGRVNWVCGAPLCLVVHGGTIMALMSRFALPEREYFQWHVPPLGGYRCRLEEETWRRERRFRLIEEIKVQ